MERQLTLDTGGLSLLGHLLSPPLPQTPGASPPAVSSSWSGHRGGLPGELSPRLSAQRALCCCDGICEAAAAARLRVRLCSARLGGRRRPSALRGAELVKLALALLRPLRLRRRLWMLLLLREGAARGPPSARPALTSPFPHPPSPSPPPQGVPSEPPAPIQPVTALSSSRRGWGRRRWRRQGTAGGRGGPAAICDSGGESQTVPL